MRTQLQELNEQHHGPECYIQALVLRKFTALSEPLNNWDYNDILLPFFNAIRVCARGAYEQKRE